MKENFIGGVTCVTAAVVMTIMLALLAAVFLRLLNLLAEFSARGLCLSVIAVILLLGFFAAMDDCQRLSVSR